MTSTTDKELLKLAAKAAGIEGPTFDFMDGVGIGEDRDGWIMWNPLTDDGDALRLAVKLKIDVHFEFDRIEAVKQDGELITEYLYELPTPTDPYAATRRAIVRAAAEIGKTL